MTTSKGEYGQDCEVCYAGDVQTGIIPGPRYARELTYRCGKDPNHEGMSSDCQQDRIVSVVAFVPRHSVATIVESYISQNLHPA